MCVVDLSMVRTKRTIADIKAIRESNTICKLPWRDGIVRVQQETFNWDNVVEAYILHYEAPNFPRAEIGKVYLFDGGLWKAIAYGVDGATHSGRCPDARDAVVELLELLG